MNKKHYCECKPNSRLIHIINHNQICSKCTFIINLEWEYSGNKEGYYNSIKEMKGGFD